MKRFVTFCTCCYLIIAVFWGSLAFATTDMVAEASKRSTNTQQVELGAYLARIGNCMGCHTAKGGQPFAGGRRLATSFGVFVTSNITPDKNTGIGLWSEEDFWQTLHHGKSRDGRLLYPVFPYTEYTKVTRQDANAIFAYLQSLPPISQSNPASDIAFPYNSQILLALWRTLFFKEGVYEPDLSKSETWNRGAYLAQGLGHCNACHTTRNVLGASQDDTLTGGEIGGMNWYAPSLSSRLEAGLSDWPIDEIVALLKTGVTERSMTLGPMGAVVRQSLQYLSEKDAHAMAIYLKSLSDNDSKISSGVNFSVMTGSLRRYLDFGGQLYEKHCQTCHGTDGKGAPGIYPALAGNRSVTMKSPLNTIRTVLHGGYPPTTQGNSRPYGMPPFQQILRNEEVALIVSYIRNTWGNRASLVTAVDVERSQGGTH